MSTFTAPHHEEELRTHSEDTTEFSKATIAPTTSQLIAAEAAELLRQWAPSIENLLLTGSTLAPQNRHVAVWSDEPYREIVRRDAKL